MFDSFVASADLLKFGALGLGLAILGYTGALLKQELSRPHPRPEARTLILMYMMFSLIAFAGGGYLEVMKQQISSDLAKTRDDLAAASASNIALTKERNDLRAQLNDLASQVSRIDESVGLKYGVEVSGLPDSAKKRSLISFTNSICRTATEMMKSLVPPRAATCKVISP